MTRRAPRRARCYVRNPSGLLHGRVRNPCDYMQPVVLNFSSVKWHSTHDTHCCLCHFLPRPTPMANRTIICKNLIFGNTEYSYQKRMEGVPYKVDLFCGLRGALPRSRHPGHLHPAEGSAPSLLHPVLSILRVTYTCSVTHYQCCLHLRDSVACSMDGA